MMAATRSWTDDGLATAAPSSKPNQLQTVANGWQIADVFMIKSARFPFLPCLIFGL
jgi:hypothetical protein